MEGNDSILETIETRITVLTVNGTLVGLAERAGGAPGECPAIVGVPGGGRVLVAPPATLALVTQLLGPGAKSANPFEERRRKEFLRRARRVLRVLFPAKKMTGAEA